MGLCVKCRFISWMCVNIIGVGLSGVCGLMFWVLAAKSLETYDAFRCEDWIVRN